MMSQQEPAKLQPVCSQCGKQVDTLFTTTLNTGGYSSIVANVCPACISSKGDVSKHLADYSPEA